MPWLYRPAGTSSRETRRGKPPERGASYCPLLAIYIFGLAAAVPLAVREGATSAPRCLLFFIFISFLSSESPSKNDRSTPGLLHTLGRPSSTSSHGGGVHRPPVEDASVSGRHRDPFHPATRDGHLSRAEGGLWGRAGLGDINPHVVH